MTLVMKRIISIVVAPANYNLAGAVLPPVMPSEGATCPKVDRNIMVDVQSINLPFAFSIIRLRLISLSSTTRRLKTSPLHTLCL